MPRSSHEEFYERGFIRLLCFLQSPLGGAASPLPDSPPHGQRGRCPSRVVESCAKLLADGVAKFCAKLSKQISRNHCPTRLTRPTRPTSPLQARSTMPRTAICKARSSVKWGCALRVVERRPLFYDAVVKDQVWLSSHPLAIFRVRSTSSKRA